jgi:sialate O-acetylesterase
MFMLSRTCHRTLGFLAAITLASSQAGAIVKPAVIFTDNAVLQRGIKVPVWGTAAEGEVVTVSFNGQVATTTARDGKWIIRLKPMREGGPFTLVIRGENKMERTNILVGEVWLCSGQSNMQWPLQETDGSEKFIAESADPGLRLFTVPLTISNLPASDLSGGNWLAAGPGTVPNFSAVAYHFGRHLRQSLGNVPLGLIHSSFGGSIVQAWTAMPCIQSDPESRQYLGKLPSWADGPQNRFSVLYNGMIAPIVPYGIRGVIWYQGEGNTESTEPGHYLTSFPLLIRNWRQAWGEGDFPFLFVQLPPWAHDGFFHVSVDPDATGWAVLRDSQFKTARKVKNTAMVVTMDLGDADHIHPRLKEPVGQRLALAAEAVAYDQHVVFQGPIFKSCKIKGNAAVLTFNEKGGGLVARDKEIVGFNIAGSDRKFYPAHATIIGPGQMEIWSDLVSEPVAVRYGWSNFAVVNMFNRAGLPMAPFRTDDWPAEKPFKTYPWPRPGN